MGTSALGLVEQPADVPLVGKWLRGLETQGPLPFEHIKHYRGHRVIVSGRVTEASLTSFCEEHGLSVVRWYGQEVDLSEMLWRGDPRDFATKFGAGHVDAIGTLRPRVRLELWYRPEDRRFLAIVSWPT